MAAETTQLFLEDFSQGQTFPGLPRTITKADALSFAALTGDSHPLHYDDEYAKTTRFGRPIVHGLHLMALTALGAAPLAERLKSSMIAFLEQNADFQRPVFKDDTVRPQFEIEGIEHQPGREWGKLKIKVRLIISAMKLFSKAGTCTGFAAGPTQRRASPRERAQAFIPTVHARRPRLRFSSTGAR
ncbi:MAG TPA: MaoC/PaaZ C-terminal domain-containing protein [Xanthobacteraceae bacterium]|nr:MaoC/PaaZ C-terminal domain-containing protein [Xanthobacteraceae bacterium]